jgi:hypothetical protein
MIGSGRGLEFDKLTDYFLNEDYRKTCKSRNKLNKKCSEILDGLRLLGNITVLVLYTGFLMFLLMVICGCF